MPPTEGTQGNVCLHYMLQCCRTHCGTSSMKNSPFPGQCHGVPTDMVSVWHGCCQALPLQQLTHLSHCVASTAKVPRCTGLVISCPEHVTGKSVTISSSILMRNSSVPSRHFDGSVVQHDFCRGKCDY